MAIVTELAKRLGRSSVQAWSAGHKGYERDFARHELGKGVAVVRPATTAEVAKLVKFARERRAALTPVGARTSFWASTPAGGRVVVDLARMSKLLELDETERVVRVEAGMTFKALDAALAKRGFWLPACPDGFGNATVASLVANDTTAGHGMHAGPASGQVVGLTVVLGTGEVLRCGGSSALSGLPAFSRHGLPDLAGVFLASEGALGIVTELALRVQPAPNLRTLEASFAPGEPAFARLLEAAQALRAGYQLHHWIHSSGTGDEPDRSTLQVASYGSEAELDAKSKRAEEVLRKAGVKDLAWLPSNPPLWQPDPGVDAFWKGLALGLPYANGPRLYGLWRKSHRARVAAVSREGDGFLRFYVGPDGLAAVLGWAHDEGEPESKSRALIEELRREVAPLGVPYRIGTVWQSAIAGRVDPAFAAALNKLKAFFDPDGILNPGVGIFDGIAAP